MDIAMRLSSRECLALAGTAHRFRWLLGDIKLWAHHAAQDYQLTRQQFKQDLSTSKSISAWKHYQRLAVCQWVNYTLLTHRYHCGFQCVPGTTYCHQHCQSKCIPLCRCGPVRARFLCQPCLDRYGPSGMGWVCPVGPLGPCGSTDQPDPRIKLRPLKLITPPPSKYKGSQRSRSLKHR